MSDLMARCDWHDSTLSIVLPEDPERIAVRLFDSRYAPARCYVPEVDVLRLQNENAKLRELCKNLYRLADESYVPLKDVNPWMNEFDNAIRAMRELGIEVDG